MMVDYARHLASESGNQVFRDFAATAQSIGADDFEIILRVKRKRTDGLITSVLDTLKKNLGSPEFRANIPKLEIKGLAWDGNLTLPIC